ncbi:MAG: hypothetical protein REJ23_14255 [Brevundimonas sp.]|nr:hypothetical protein [Brevundimonas sp.]
MFNTLALLALAVAPGDIGSATVLTDFGASRPIAIAQDSLPALQEKFTRALQQERTEEALGHVKAILGHPDFARAPEQRRLSALYLAGLLNLELGRHAAAAPYLVEATSVPGATQEQWFYRLQAQAGAGDLSAAAASLTIMLDRFPGVLDDLSDRYVAQLVHSSELDDDTAFRLRSALYEANWDYEFADWIWVSLINDLVKRDRGAEAAPMVARVSLPDARLQLFSLHRYDAIRPADATLDLQRLYASSLELQRKAVEKPDAALSDFVAYAGGLSERAQFEQALAIADAALARPAPEADSEDAEQLTWIMDIRSRALMALGRPDEALAQMQAAMARSEGGVPNVSQTINLGWLYMRMGRNAEAVEAVSEVTEGAVSPYGMMQALQVRACAAAAMGDEATAAPAFAHLAENWKDASAAAYGALACRGDEEGMAALMIARLTDPKTADDTLQALHTYIDTPNMTAFDIRLSEVHRRVIARPEVIAARDAVGQVYEVPTIGPEF